ncbi:alkaline phosphatase D family protein [Algoriphagus antarcticus]|uniref:Alkaline phosphatase D n=1 Tax=Algoriphagus antarcticus TaxID=238540 RepID=A0A3E0E243_9BACT|nr:alkaline phosphatase D family protein [Algoriphagus antarcticus]REG91399.1 alkaline phosphatase D [Algoriphagus antarcticus]
MNLSRIITTVFILSIAFSCKQQAETSVEIEQNVVEPIDVIAFGSCNRQDEPQPLWEPIISHNSDLFIWLGDNIYGDTDSMAVMKEKYELQNSIPAYQKLKAKTPIVGIWDDHDFGKNDAGNEYPYKDESRDLMYDFLDVPAESPLRDKKGGYGAYSYGPEGKRVKVILLDARYFRDTIGMENRTYIPNETGTILGDTQWKWLEDELKNNDAQVTIIGSGIQVLPKDHQFEKWANFPYEREKLLNLIGTYQTNGVVLLSGDRHIAEISKMEVPGIDHPVYEVTSSGLTHTWREYKDEPNQYRTGDLIAKLNFGMLYLDWQEDGVEVKMEVRGVMDSLYLEETFKRMF